MANPQLEDGYTRIATELLEELAKTRMSGEMRQVFDVIVRKTYGYQKTEDKISVSQFAKLTGLNRRSIFRSLEKLKHRNIIRGVKNHTSQVVTYCIQKDYEKWRGVSKLTGVSKSVSGGVKNGIKLVSKMTPTIDNTIDNNTIDTRFPFKSVWEKYPNKVGVKAAKRHFLASVKTQADFDNINKALDNYIKSERVTKGFIQNGSTWFNDWQAWVDYEPKNKVYEMPDL